MLFFQKLRLNRIVFSVILLVTISVFSQSVFASTIAGFVFDKQRNPLARIDVELLNENHQLRDRTKTDGVGRFQFGNVVDGRYYIRVLPFRLDFQDEERFIEVNTFTIRGEGNGYFNADFYLSPKKGGLADTTTGVVYAQEVPKEAEAYYKDALKDFSKKKDGEGMKKLLKSIEIFPEYYQALYRLGNALFARKQYLEATQAFMQSVNVNPKSSKSFYYMGYSLSKLGKKYNKAAIVAFQKAFALAPASYQTAYMLGKVERIEGNYENAEKHLLKAKKLSRTKVPEIHIELAQLYGNNLKKYGKAADELELYLKASKKKDKKIKEKIVDLRRKAKRNS